MRARAHTHAHAGTRTQHFRTLLSHMGILINSSNIRFRPAYILGLELVAVTSIGSVVFSDTGVIGWTANDLGFLACVASATIVQIVAFFLVARYIFPNYWWERGIVEIGQQVR